MCKKAKLFQPFSLKANAGKASGKHNFLKRSGKLCTTVVDRTILDRNDTCLKRQLIKTKLN